MLGYWLQIPTLLTDVIFISVQKCTSKQSFWLWLLNNNHLLKSLSSFPLSSSIRVIWAQPQSTCHVFHRAWLVANCCVETSVLVPKHLHSLHSLTHLFIFIFQVVICAHNPRREMCRHVHPVSTVACITAAIIFPWFSTVFEIPVMNLYKGNRVTDAAFGEILAGENVIH